MKNKKRIINFILIIFILLLSISTYKIIKYNIDENNINKQLNIINEIVNIETENDNKKIEIITQEDNISEINPYWDYIKMDLIDVDFNELKSINNDVKGWIQVNGTNINYPFVQTTNNKHYLKHSFDKTNNNAGWVFLDYRNNLTNINDKNTILYAHGMKNNAMFGSLRNIISDEWLNNSNNFIVKLSTEYENTLWQVFSVYKIENTSDYIQTSFDNNDDFINFTDTLINRSIYNFNTDVSENDRILTLSTCYDNYNKIVLHAKLIKREIK